jgi:uncharacterized membrane protein YqiK
MSVLTLLFVAGGIVASLAIIGGVIAAFWKKPNKEIVWVITGGKKERVLMDQGGLVYPIVNESVPINMTTAKLEFAREGRDAFLTQDNMRCDVRATFFTRVQPNRESVLTAARTMGRGANDKTVLRNLIEDKFENALRDVAKQMSLDELIQNREDFVQRVQAALTDDLNQNGLELESVSITKLDQTPLEFYNPDNKYDAEALTRIKKRTEEMRKAKNDIERDTEVQIAAKDTETEKSKLALQQDEQFARLAQQREVENRRAAESSNIAREQADRQREAEQAAIEAKRATDLARVQAEQEVSQRDIMRSRQIQLDTIEREKAEKLAIQQREVEVSEMSMLESKAQAQAELARAEAVRAEEQVVTAQATEIANRSKQVEVIKASEVAETKAVQIKIAAEADRLAETDRAAAAVTKAEGEGKSVTVAAQADAEAEITRARAKEETYRVDAEGRAAMIEAENQISAEIQALQIKLETLKQLPRIIAEQVKPMERIESMKVVDIRGLQGLTGGGASANGSGGGDGKGSGNLAQDLKNAALQYRAEAPLVDDLLRQVGLADENGSGSLSLDSFREAGREAHS